MSTAEQQAAARKTYFEDAAKRMAGLAGRFTDDVDATLADAGERFDAMLPDVPYVDKPDDIMAPSMLACAASLALYLALAERGVDVHDFGAGLVDGLARAPERPAEIPTDPEESQRALERMFAAAEASQTDAAPGEFVYEAFTGDKEGSWGVNIKSCAICAFFSKYDAMDLVPYMCATDDVVSDKGNQGLRRTGTIALGAHQCDFHYEIGGEPLRVAEQYPERIRLLPAD